MTIVPTINCNMSCKFCINRKLKDYSEQKQFLLDLSILRKYCEKYPQIFKKSEIIGGEISLLPKSYMNELIHLLKQYSENPIEITSNGTNDLNDSFGEFSDVDLIVSYDFNFRENSNKVLNNIINYNGFLSINTIMSSEFINTIGIDKLKYLTRLKNIKCLGLVMMEEYPGNPYHSPSEIQMEQIIDFYINNKNIRIGFEYEYMANVDQIIETYIARNILILPNGKFIDPSRWIYSDKLEDLISPIENMIAFPKKNKESCSTCKYLKQCHILKMDKYCFGRKDLFEKLISRDN